MVPKGWEHPKNEQGKFIPQFLGNADRFASSDAEWNEGYAKWQQGLCENYEDGEKWKPIPEEYKAMRYTDYNGGRPSPDDYMPSWPADVATHYMMYENTTEGTPISPAFETPEELTQWLVDNKASAFGPETGTYEGWLRVAKGGYAPSMVFAPADGLKSGVDAFWR